MLHRSVYGAFQPVPAPVLLVASAASPPVAALLRRTLSGAASRSGRALAVHDLVPLPSSDSSGATSFSVVLSLILAGLVGASLVYAFTMNRPEAVRVRVTLRGKLGPRATPRLLANPQSTAATRCRHHISARRRVLQRPRERSRPHRPHRLRGARRRGGDDRAQAAHSRRRRQPGQLNGRSVPCRCSKGRPHVRTQPCRACESGSVPWLGPSITEIGGAVRYRPGGAPTSPARRRGDSTIRTKPGS